MSMGKTLTSELMVPKGSFRLDAGYWVFHSRLHQHRDRMFSIFLQHVDHCITTSTTNSTTTNSTSITNSTVTNSTVTNSATTNSLQQLYHKYFDFPDRYTNL